MTIPQSSFQWKRPFLIPRFYTSWPLLGSSSPPSSPFGPAPWKVGGFLMGKMGRSWENIWWKSRTYGIFNGSFCPKGTSTIRESHEKSCLPPIIKNLFPWDGKINHRFSNKTLDFRGALFSDPRSNLKWLDFCKLIVFENMPLFTGAVFDFADPRPGWSVASCCSLEPTQSPDWTISWAVFKTTSRPFTSINIHYNHYSLYVGYMYIIVYI